jgi:ParB family transcriptional regulator, chromosome partitioning protein
MTRKALGRGLSALIREPESPDAPGDASSSIATISIDLIDPNPFQPRSKFPEAELQELADSIRANGVIQPVLVRHHGDRYQLIAGERRWRAARSAGLDAVPAVVREMDDREALEIALTENLLRDDLSPLEAARAYQALQERFGASQEEIAKRLGLNRSTVANTLRLLRLPAQIQMMIDSKALTAGHARALLMIPSEEEQLRLAGRIVARGLSVREIEKLAAEGARSSPATVKEHDEPAQDPNIKAAVLELERKLGTRVKISGDGQRGKIEISYFSAEDLNRLYELVLGAPAERDPYEAQHHVGSEDIL